MKFNIKAEEYTCRVFRSKTQLNAYTSVNWFGISSYILSIIFACILSTFSILFSMLIPFIALIFVKYKLGEKVTNVESQQIVSIDRYNYNIESSLNAPKTTAWRRKLL